ncbi:MAG: transposase [Pontiellaceae bacterium]|nr:transposase [Pontiellaceae bacterium]
MYNWRKMTERQREEVISLRRACQVPLHSPPHYEVPGRCRYHLSAANYEHAPIIGASSARMSTFSAALCDLFSGEIVDLYAWCVLPNHWHALVGTETLSGLIKSIGKLHGRTSFEWNGQDGQRGRRCWFCCADRRIRSESHFYAVRNYIHHNPVKHGYVDRWEEWPFSSAVDFLEMTGRDEALRQWREFPVLNMGEKWDID